MTGRTSRVPARRPGPGLLALWWTLVVVVVTAVVTVVLVRSNSPTLQVSAVQRQMIDTLENVLLHDSVTPQYARVVNQYDGRGLVTGAGDFATSDGGTLEVVRTYTARVGVNELARTYQSTLEQRAGAHSGDTAGLVGFAEAWRRAASDGVFRAVQDDVLTARSYSPAVQTARDLGLTSALGLAIIYDALLQHGAAADPDGLPTLIERATARAHGTPGQVAEHDWLAAFLQERRAMLLGPAQSGHRAVWPLTIGRVDVLSTLLTGGHDDLRPPIEVNPYGTVHLLDPRALGDDGGPLDGGDAAGPTPTRPPAPARPTRTGATPSARPPSSPRGSTSTTSRPPATVAPPPGTTGVTPQSGLVVRIISVTSGKAFGVADGSYADGALIVQQSGRGSLQQWRLTQSAAGCFVLVNQQTGRALDNPDGSDNWGIPMQQWGAGPPGNPNQAWCFDAAGPGVYAIRSLVSGLLLDLQEGSLVDGTVIQQWPSSGVNPNQQWRLEKVR